MGGLPVDVTGPEGGQSRSGRDLYKQYRIDSQGHNGIESAGGRSAICDPLAVTRIVCLLSMYYMRLCNASGKQQLHRFFVTKSESNHSFQRG